MATTYQRICLEDYTIEDAHGTTFTLRRGEEYLTSPEREGQVCVYARYWVWVPARIFAGERRFT